jgi:adenylate cyclase
LASEDARRLDDVELVSQLASRLREELPLGRFSISVRTMHPEVYVRNLVWTPEEGTQLFVRPHEVTDTPGFRDSPIPKVLAGTDRIRVRLAALDDLPFPICRELRDQGATDYLVHRLPLYERVNTFASYATWEPGGFSDHHLAILDSIVDVLSLRIALSSVLKAARSLLATYLGQEASARVLAGGFTRGSGQLLDAVIWSCDMRGFTSMVDRHRIEEVIDLLDRYFECVATPIERHGGEILKLIGDAVLAVFPLHGATRAGDGALSAAKDALREVAKLRTPSGEPVRIGVALHVGEVLFGNVGASRRLDFTVIGRAVNEVCRVEARCKELEVPLLLTGDFVELLGPEAATDIAPLGRHALRGVSHETELFTLRSYRPA